MSTNHNLLQSASPANPTTPLDYVVFAVGELEYGVELSKVQYWACDAEIVASADANGFFKGSINVQGTEVPVIDLRNLLAPHEPAGDGTRNLLVLRLADTMVGVLVDSIPDRMLVHAEHVRPLAHLAPA